MASTLRDLLLAGEFDGAQYDELVKLCGPQDWSGLLELGSHPDGAVRRALVSTLPHLCDPPPASWIELVVELTADPEARVRDWACFTLGEHWREIDTPAVRQALADRLDDVDFEVRCGALVGLAYRRDPRALPRVRAALARPSGKLSKLELEAAGALGNPGLYPLVLQHLDGWEESGLPTAEVVRRLTHPNGPGGDLFAGVAELYRARSHHTPDPDSGLAAWFLMSTMLDLCPDRAPGYLREVGARLRDDPAALDELTHRSVLAQLAADVE